MKLTLPIFSLATALLCSNIFPTEPSIPTAHFEAAKQARASFERGDFREAERIYETILAESPDNLYVLSNLGVTRFRAGKLKLAEDAFRRAIAVAPTDEFSLRTLGIVYYAQGKYEEAVNVLTKALAINPRNVTAHRYLGIIAGSNGWRDAAEKAFEALDPSPKADFGFGDFLTPLEKSRLQLPSPGK